MAEGWDYNPHACMMYKMGGAPPNPSTLTFKVWGGAEHHLAAPSFYTAPLPRQNVTNPPSPLLLFLFGKTAVRRWVEARLTDSKLSSAAYRNNQPRGLSTTNPRLAQLHCMGRLHERGNRKPSKLVTAKWGRIANDASHTIPQYPSLPQFSGWWKTWSYLNTN